jgi:hypothetical protein
MGERRRRCRVDEIGLFSAQAGMAVQPKKSEQATSTRARSRKDAPMFVPAAS